jgi:hypothetical protein
MSRSLVIYIASSWKNQCAVELLTRLLRDRGHLVNSFVENNHHDEKADPPDLASWVWSDSGRASFVYDTNSATTADLVIYVGPSGPDAWAEVGAAWASDVPIIALQAKGEQIGLMRRMAVWTTRVDGLLDAVDLLEEHESFADGIDLLTHPTDVGGDEVFDGHQERHGRLTIVCQGVTVPL